jgi:hypothetical protein
MLQRSLSRLKSKYQEHHQKLGMTGHGLVTADKEDEITAGSEIANAWGTYFNPNLLYIR